MKELVDQTILGMPESLVLLLTPGVHLVKPPDGTDLSYTLVSLIPINKFQSRHSLEYRCLWYTTLHH